MKPVDQIIYSTIRLEGKYKNGTSGVGTGFLYMFGSPFAGGIMTVVTNAHMIQNAIEISFYLTFTEGELIAGAGNHYRVVLKNVTQRTKYHPEGLDLCAFSIQDIVISYIDRGFKITTANLDSTILPTPKEIAAFSALEDVLMVGYPIGVWDAVNNKPVLRRGISATDIKIDYNGRPEFLIDIASHHGSSGSPVFLHATKNIRLADNSHIFAGSVLLLGILYAGPAEKLPVYYLDKSDVQWIERDDSDYYIKLPSNLGIVIKAHKILDIFSL